MAGRLLVLATLAIGVAGCAHDAEWMQRQEPVESTIGKDPRDAPAGKVIPPPGMGVDMGAFTRDRDTHVRV